MGYAVVTAPARQCLTAATTALKHQPLMSLVRYVEDQDDGPVGVAVMMVLTLGNDKRLLFAVRAEKQHVAFHGQALHRRQGEIRVLVLGVTRHQLFDLA